MAKWKFIGNLGNELVSCRGSLRVVDWAQLANLDHAIVVKQLGIVRLGVDLLGLCVSMIEAGQALTNVPDADSTESCRDGGMVKIGHGFKKHILGAGTGCNGWSGTQ